MFYPSRKNKSISLALSLLLSTHVVRTEPITIAIVTVVSALSGVGGGAYYMFGGKADDEKPVRPQATKIEGMVGEYDEDIQFIVDNWHNDPLSKKSEDRAWDNRMILSGEKGNGKTMMARQIALEKGCAFLSYDAASLMSRYVNSGPEKIEEIFEKAIEIANKEGRRVVLAIDEIDLIASRNAGRDNAREYEKTEAKFWMCVEKYANDNRIFIIGTTNKVSLLDERLKDRFKGHIIRVNNPDANQREAVMHHYCLKHNGIDFNVACPEKCRENFMKVSNDLSIRDLEEASKRMRREIVKGKATVVSESLINSVVKEVKQEKIKSNNEEDERDSQNEKSWYEKAWYISQAAAGVCSVVKSTADVVVIGIKLYNGDATGVAEKVVGKK